MFSDTLLEEDQNARLDPGPPASDAQMAQMGGATTPLEPQEPPPAPPPGPNPPPDAPAPTTPPPGAPTASQTPAQDLLKQVQGGQITQPAIDKAFGPPPMPPNEPNASAFAPKLGDSPGIDWKGLSDRLSRARGYDSSSKLRDNVLTNLASVLNPRAHVDSGANETAGAEDAVKLAQAQQASGIQNSQEADRKAQLERQNKADEWRQLHERMQLTQQAQQAADKLKAEKSTRDMTAEEKAVADQRAEQALQETTRHNQATEKEHEDALAARARARSGVSPKAKAAADKAAKTETNVQTMVDNIYNGKSDPAELGSRSNEFKQDFETKMNEQHPDFSLAKSSQLFKGLNEYSDVKPGSAGDQVQAAKVAANHLDLMERQFKKLDNSDSRGANELRNAFAKQFGYSDAAQALGAMKAGSVTTGSELAKTYNDVSQHGHESFENILDPATPPKVAAEQFAIIREQMAVRMKQREDALRRYAQTPGHQKLVDELGLSQKAGGNTAGGGDGEVTVTNKKTKTFRKMNAKDAEKYRGQEGYEVSGG